MIFFRKLPQVFLLLFQAPVFALYSPDSWKIPLYRLLLATRHPLGGHSVGHLIREANLSGLICWSGMLRGRGGRDLQYGLQLAVAFAVSALVAYRTPLYSSVPIAWVVPVLATILIADSFGGCFLMFVLGVKNFVTVSVVVFVMQTLGMGFHDYLSSTLVYLLLCFWIGYSNPNIQARKIALFYPGLLFSTIVITPNDVMPWNFTWKLLLEIFISYFCTLAISALFLPRFATIEILDRFEYSLQNSTACFRLVVNAMFSSHRSQAEVFLSQAEALLGNLTENQEAMNARLSLTEYEPSGLLRRLTSQSRRLYSSRSPAELITLSSTLLWHMSCLTEVVGKINFNEYHALAWTASKRAFEEALEQVKAVIDLISSDPDPETLSKGMNTLTLACDSAYKSLALYLAAAEKSKSAGNAGGASQKNLQIDFSKQGIYDIDAPPQSNRLTPSYFLFHFTEFISIIQLKFNANDATKVPAMISPINILHSLQVFYQRMTSDVHNKVKNGSRSMLLMGVALAFVETPALSRKFENGLLRVFF